MNIESRGFLALGVAAFIGGCTSSASDVVNPLSADLAKDAHITAITIKSVPDNVSPAFKDTLARYLQQELDACAKGRHALRLEATVAQFSSQNPGMTFLAGDSNKIKGTAQLIDAADGSLVGDYDISRSFGAGGLLGMALLANGEDQMTHAFATEVCDRAFLSNQ